MVQILLARLLWIYAQKSETRFCVVLRNPCFLAMLAVSTFWHCCSDNGRSRAYIHAYKLQWEDCMSPLVACIVANFKLGSS